MRAHNDFAAGQERLPLPAPKTPRRRAAELAVTAAQANLLAAELIEVSKRLRDGLCFFVMGGEIITVDTDPDGFAPGVEAIFADGREIKTGVLRFRYALTPPGQDAPPRSWGYDGDERGVYQANIIGRVIDRRPLPTRH